MNKSKKLSAKQQEEIKRRSYTYLSYLLRSPVYDTCTKYEMINATKQLKFNLSFSLSFSLSLGPLSMS